MYSGVCKREKCLQGVKGLKNCKYANRITDTYMPNVFICYSHTSNTFLLFFSLFWLYSLYTPQRKWRRRQTEKWWTTFSIYSTYETLPWTSISHLNRVCEHHFCVHECNFITPNAYRWNWKICTKTMIEFVVFLLLLSAIGIRCWNDLSSSLCVLAVHCAQAHAVLCVSIAFISIFELLLPISHMKR